jgi:hypothetical protein
MNKMQKGKTYKKLQMVWDYEVLSVHFSNAVTVVARVCASFGRQLGED